jgi:type I restriction enzyme S subunit
MKRTWEHKKLGEVISLEYGKPLLSDLRKSDGKYPVYGANGIKDRTDKYFYDNPSIIIGRKGSAGEINLTEEKFWPLDVTYYVVYDQKKYDRKFLFYLLSNLQLQKLAKGVKPGINRNDVYSIEAEFPTLPEQQRIVDILDQSFAAIDQAIENTERNIERNEEFYYSYKLKLFFSNNNHWDEKRIDQISENLDSKRIPITQNKRKKGIYPYYGATGIVDYVDDFIFDEDLLLISEDGANLIMRNYPIAFSVSGKIWVNNHAHVLRFNNITTQRFIEYYFSVTKLDKFITGAAQPKFNQAALNSIKVKIPSLDEQIKIVKKLDEINDHVYSLKSNYQQKHSKLLQLKQSILQKAFYGEL